MISFQQPDLPALHAIRHAAFEPVFASFRAILGDAIAPIALAHAEEEQEQLLSAICEPGSKHTVFVAQRGDELVGFVSWSLDASTKVGEIGLNGVHPDHAGRGIGTRLYTLALEHMKADGMRVATVGTGGDPSHAPARRAYEKVGFGPTLPSL